MYQNKVTVTSVIENACPDRIFNTITLRYTKLGIYVNTSWDSGVSRTKIRSL